jgi:hypothetical protein
MRLSSALMVSPIERRAVNSALLASVKDIYQFCEVNEQDLRDFERLGEQLSELRREIASFITTHWDPKDVTF